MTQSTKSRTSNHSRHVGDGPAGVALILYFCLAVLSGDLASPAFSAPPTDSLQEFYEDALERFNDGDYTGAIVQLKNSLQGNSTDAQSRLLLGRAYLAVGAGAAAEKEILKARGDGAHPSSVMLPLAKAYML